ncbi:MAG: serine--tRNA ligase, partial [Bacteroidales bacterium]|nr:serine--tRNA ligase [Bacteroidales bacterium]
MLTIKFIEENKEEVIRLLAIKGFEAGEIIEQLLETDVLRKKMQVQADLIQAELNTKSKEIGALMKSGQKEVAERAKSTVSELKEKAGALLHEQESAEQKLKDLLVQLPNVPHHSVPVGKSAADNVVVRSGGQVPDLPENALPHWDL